MQCIRRISPLILATHQPVKMVGQDDVGQQAEGMDELNAAERFPEQLKIVL